MNAPPPTRVVELRTHGVSGTPPESILYADHVIQVAGDDSSRFFRRSTSDGEEIGSAPLVGDDGTPVPRLLEAYHWGNLTSGGWRKATWALLFPFALVNIAQWTLPPSQVGRARRALGYGIRGVNRLVALGLTVLFAVQAEVITVDLFGSQCLAPVSASNRCLGSVSLLRGLRDHPAAPLADGGRPARAARRRRLVRDPRRPEGLGHDVHPGDRLVLARGRLGRVPGQGAQRRTARPACDGRVRCRGRPARRRWRAQGRRMEPHRLLRRVGAGAAGRGGRVPAQRPVRWLGTVPTGAPDLRGRTGRLDVVGLRGGQLPRPRRDRRRTNAERRRHAVAGR